MSGKELVKLLLQNGWTVDHINSSHYILKRDDQTLSVPVHRNQALKPGLLNALLKTAGLK